MRRAKRNLTAKQRYVVQQIRKMYLAGKPLNITAVKAHDRISLSLPQQEVFVKQ